MKNKNVYPRLYKNENGITIIVLAITIVVMMILAGASINLLAGEGRNFTSNARCKKTTRRTCKGAR